MTAILDSYRQLQRLILAAILALAVTGTITDTALANSDVMPVAANLKPLSHDDIALYLQVMRAAAERLRTLSPADRKTIADYQALASGEADQQQTSGQTPEAAAAQTQQSARALQLMTAMDEMVAADEHVDIGRYDAIKERVEAVISPADCNACGGDDTGGADPDDDPLNAGQRREADRLAAIAQTDTRSLAPYRTEIQALLRAVREYQLPATP